METTELKETEVIREILAGDKNRYALLIGKYNQRLYRICRGYLKDENEIEDVMQETYIKAFEHLTMFEGRSTFGTWIIRILVNECLQRIRSRNKYRAFTGNFKNLHNMHADHNNPESKSVSRELRILLEEKVASLPESYRLVFIMREIERMNVSETAEALFITESNVKVRLNRAKEMLKKILLDEYSLPELFEFNLVRCGRIAENVLKKLQAGQL